MSLFLLNLKLEQKLLAETGMTYNEWVMKQLRDAFVLQETRDNTLNLFIKKQSKGDDVQVYDIDSLIASYKTKKAIKTVFVTESLDRIKFKEFCIINKSLNATKMVVYCLSATYDSPSTVEIIIIGK